MRRVLKVVVLPLAIAMGLLWPLLFLVLPASNGQSGHAKRLAASDPDSWTMVYTEIIDSYDATYRLDADGRLTVSERLQVDFSTPRHGIYRYWDVASPADSRVRLIPQVTAVTFDGKPVQVDYRWDKSRSVRVAKIGDPDVRHTGTHSYQIDYVLDSALAPAMPGEGDFPTRSGENAAPPGSTFYWDVLASWDMPVRAAAIDIELPGAAGLVQCGAGPGECQLDVAGPTVRLAAEALPPHSPITVRADLAVAPPPLSTLPWSVTWDRILGRSAPGVVATALGAIAMFGLGLWGAARAREAEPGLPVLYEPPAGLGPVQTVHITRESPGRHALSASLLFLAERGLVELTPLEHKKWRLTNIGGPERWSALDPVTRAAADALGVSAPGGQFSADLSVPAGRILVAADAAVVNAADAWARQSGLIERARGEFWGRVAVWVCAAAAIGGFLGIVGPTMLGLPFAAFVLGGAGMVAGGVGTRRTTAGREVWSRAGGFERLLSTPSSEERFDFSARKDLFLAFIPYAAAFGVADKWAEKYRTATGQSAPEPAWYPIGGSAGRSTLFAAGGVAGFETALNSSISAYRATQSSSSSGGGGSVGGGGGGGGGGTW